MIKLMYITNNPTIAEIADSAGVDRVFIDLEVVGKAERQGGMDTVQSHHSISDIPIVKQKLRNSELLVRSNPIYNDSKNEINKIVTSGADIIMLPFFKTAEEVTHFVDYVGGRARTILLFETKESVDCIDEILAIDGIDEYYIGLNDLHLSYGLDFMFQLLADGTVDNIVTKFKATGKPYGFGGIAKLGGGLLPAEHVIAEHYRLGSTIGILSRSFCNCDKVSDKNIILSLFDDGVSEIRTLEYNLANQSAEFFEENHKFVINAVNDIVRIIRSKK
ncbi:aldolase/citrate lyase family protein [Bacteroides caecimuris]|uniref:aldolase/citrate lyase family protein n=1 Tax=Bacteroides caecimuris TaxID=1796613 RepID=UPI0025702715|nr:MULTISPECIES: aldolase/citrate lyase family protein [Bacteroides]